MKKEITINANEMIELETWLKENEDTSKKLSEYLEIFSKMAEEQREYLLMAKMMPLEEIEASLEYYDGHRFPVQIDEVLFIDNLAKKYLVDRIAVIKRIKQVRMINSLKKSTNKTKKRKK